ncbi:Alpha/Beta hydrolase protein [Copromyces sp. CBS 386.78]|nr:Alpha/Beta hydrolase protein [Copromyces sp. CBS 386.78]
MAEPIETRNFFPALQRNVTPTASGSEVVSYTSDLGNGGPILTLIHGYPQSALIWRHLVPLLQSKVSLFIPELPGYGISTPISAGTGEHTKRAVGRALVDALAQVFGTSSSSSPRKIMLAGHDRGARICHRLAVDASSSSPSDPEGTNFFAGVNLSVAGVIMLDILPTKSQWDLFSSPPISQSYFHWPLLANVELAVPMIQAFGVANWVRGAHLRLAGSAEDSKLRIMKDDVMETHVKLFEREDVVRWTCEDYKAGAAREVQEQVEDLKQGRRVEVPTLVMFSREKLGQGGKLDVKGVWRGTAGQKDRWVGEGVELEVVGVEGGRGHYLPEEAYDVVGERVVTFLERFGL